MRLQVRAAYRGNVQIGMGLFAGQNIRAKENVVGMKKDKVTRFTEKRWNKHYKEKNLPHDAAIYVSRINKRITDWQDTMPLWYRLNHSKNPNLEMTYQNHRIVWVATRNIKNGEELTFDYGEGVEDWD